MGVFGSRQSGSTTVTENSSPWEGIQPGLRQAAQDAQNLYNLGLLKPQYYPGQTIADQSPDTLLAQDLTRQRALNGSPINAANKNMLTDTLNGKYLSPDSNPYLKDTFNKAADQVQGRVNSAFAMGGRSGSGINQEVLGKNYNSLANDIYGGNYQQERSNQMRAGMLAPGAAAADYADLSALSNVGAAQDARAQSLINEQIDRYNANQAAPAQNIQNYIGLLNGSGGQYGSTTKSQPNYSNPGLNALGLGLLGGSMFGGSLLSGLNSFSQPWGFLTSPAGTYGPFESIF